MKAVEAHNHAQIHQTANEILGGVKREVEVQYIIPVANAMGMGKYNFIPRPDSFQSVSYLFNLLTGFSNTYENVSKITNLLVATNY